MAVQSAGLYPVGPARVAGRLPSCRLHGSARSPQAALYGQVVQAPPGSALRRRRPGGRRLRPCRAAGAMRAGLTRTGARTSSSSGRRCPGGFASHCVLPLSLLHAVPEGVPRQIAVLAEPLAVALHALGHLHHEPKRIAVLGHSPIGALVHVEARRRWPGSGDRRRRAGVAATHACARRWARTSSSRTGGSRPRLRHGRRRSGLSRVAASRARVGVTSARRPARGARARRRLGDAERAGRAPTPDHRVPRLHRRAAGGDRAAGSRGIPLRARRHRDGRAGRLPRRRRAPAAATDAVKLLVHP